MILNKPSDLLNIDSGDNTILKPLLSNLIEGSRNPNSSHYENTDFEIYGQIERGINWIGRPLNIKGIIAKSNLPENNRYTDGFMDPLGRNIYKYYFQEFSGYTDLGHLNNTFLANQIEAHHTYPVILFTEKKDGKYWRFEGYFDVREIRNDIGSRKYCLLLKRIKLQI